MSPTVSSEWYNLFEQHNCSQLLSTYKSLDQLDDVPSLSFLKDLIWQEIRRWIQNDTTTMSLVSHEDLPRPGRVYLGGMNHALNDELLRESSISAVITIHPRDLLAWDARDVSYGLRRYGDDGSPVRHHLMVPLEDNSNSNLIDHFDDTYHFIHEHLAAGHNMLIHCKSGRSRSVAVLIAYLQRRHYETVVQPRALDMEEARAEMSEYREAATHLIRRQRLPVIIIMERFQPLIELYDLQLLGHPGYERGRRALFPDVEESRQAPPQNIDAKGGAAVLKICIAILFYENGQRPLESMVRRLLDLNEAYFYELEASEYNGRSYAKSRHAHRGIIKFYADFARAYGVAIPSAVCSLAKGGDA